MKNFYVFNHPKYGQKIEKDGFTFLGFFFTIFWLFAKKQYKPATVFLLLWIVGTFATAIYVEQAGDLELARGGFGLVMIACTWFVGFKGRAWVLDSLEKRGFDLVCIVEAHTKDAVLSELAKRSDGTTAAERAYAEKAQVKVLQEDRQRIWWRKITGSSVPNPVPSDVYCKKYNVTEEMVSKLIGRGMLKAYGHGSVLYVDDIDPSGLS